MSLPVWGVWIEICVGMLLTVVTVGRSPYGECGLKFQPSTQDHHTVWSLPVWGVWIEIDGVLTVAPDETVAPRMGSVD